MLDTELLCAWVLADALYGADSRLRRMLEERGKAYVLAVHSNQCLRLREEDGVVQTDPEARRSLGGGCLGAMGEFLIHSPPHAKKRPTCTICNQRG